MYSATSLVDVDLLLSDTLKNYYIKICYNVLGMILFIINSLNHLTNVFLIILDCFK